MVARPNFDYTHYSRCSSAKILGDLLDNKYPQKIPPVHLQFVFVAMFAHVYTS